MPLVEKTFSYRVTGLNENGEMVNVTLHQQTTSENGDVVNYSSAFNLTLDAETARDYFPGQVFVLTLTPA